MTEKTLKLQITKHLETIQNLQTTIIENEKLIEQLRYAATHDILTKLPNRAYFDKTVETAINRLHRRPDYKFAIMFLDLDNFKQVNDTLGHLVGDTLLQQASERIETIVRDTDMVARLGGDEFAIFVDDLQTEVRATEVAQRIVESLAKPFNINDQPIQIGVSVGITYSNTSYSNTKEMVEDADSAMYLSKKLGRGKFTVFSK